MSSSQSTHCTKQGEGHSKNQDRWTILNTGKVHSMVVCDGHGDTGEKVSQFICPLVAHTVLSFVIDAGGIENPAAVKAARDALLYLDRMAKNKLGRASTESGCTIAGYIMDSSSGSGLAFSVGDSLVYISDDSSQTRTFALPLQNANNAPIQILEMADRSRAKLIGIPPGSNSKYMLFPGTSDGLQLYSAIGDFDLKKVNPLVKTAPLVRRFTATSGKTAFLVSSDGYLDGIQHEALTTEWYSVISRELQASKGDARDLVQMAVDRGSTDDITVLTNFF